MKPTAVIFDAYGTLFDVHSVVLRAGRGIAGNLQVLSDLWRRRQLERTWLLALMERYEDFDRVTESALRAAIQELNLEVSGGQIRRLIKAYLSPRSFPDVRGALESLTGTPLAILSNGTPGMIEAAVRHNGLASFFRHLISVDQVQTYKPSRLVYALGPEILNVPAAQILFVSSNAWDAAGAKAFGYQVCWCNRSGAAADDLGFAPDFTVSGLDQIAEKPRCSWAGADPQMVAYHDEEWGVPERDSRALWEKLMLDGFQAGLSWSIILRKRDAFRKAFKNFDPKKVARFDEHDVARLLEDPGIVRSRAKIEATIAGARAYLKMKDEGEDFSTFVWTLAGNKPIQNRGPVPSSTPLSEELSKALKKRGFKFVGPVIVYAWMQAVGIVNDHSPDCFRR